MARSRSGWSSSDPWTTLIDPQTWENDGSALQRMDRGTASRTRAVTTAPSPTRIRVSHEPTRPVAPVTKTFRFRHPSATADSLPFPHGPRPVPLLPLPVQRFRFLERVHRLPESPVLVDSELSVRGQAPQGSLLHRPVV